MATKKQNRKFIPSELTIHHVLSINQHNIIEYLKCNGFPLPDDDRETINILNKNAMEYIKNEMAAYLFESGAYNDALNIIYQSDFFEGLFGTDNAE